MRHPVAVYAAVVSAAMCCCVSAGSPDRALWFDQPADRFTQSCLLGNGRLGAMVFGGVDAERIVLNEEGMWSGSPQDADREQAAEALPEIRRLLVAGKNAEAEALVNQHFTCAGRGSGHGRGKNTQYGSYQTLGDLHLAFQYPNHASQGDEVEGYRRTLSLDQGVSTVTFQRSGVTFKREAFVSHNAQAVVCRVTADQPGQVAFTAWLSRAERATLLSDGNQLELFGQLEDGKRGEDGVRYAARLKVLATGGSVEVQQGKLLVKSADEALVLVTAATDIQSFGGRAVDDARQTAQADMQQVRGTFQQLYQQHLVDHQQVYRRVSLSINDGTNQPNLPTPKLLHRTEPADAELVATLFDYGRYLMLGSSRPGGLPANLQGIWAEELQTPWNADWHANVNVQMNYWLAGPCAMSEFQEPLVALVESLVEPGQRTARKYYSARGWVGHLLINPWGFTSPGESASWGSTPTCSAWLCQHLWDHYLFTQDTEYLRRVYPVLRGASEFYADMLIEEPSHNWLVTAPSNSPENAFLDDQGRKVHTCMGPAGDQQLLRYLFDAVIESSKLLGQDQAFAEKLQQLRNRLAPTQVGADGRVMEWLQPREEEDPQHRHISHLWGLYPANEINSQATPELFAAARKTLDVRGDGATGWAIAYKACMWARLGDGDRALKLLRRLLRPVGVKSGGIRWQGGVYPNLLDAHPPFQIDGNFGATAAVAEMLLQSNWVSPSSSLGPQIHLLPALPGEWTSGEVHGLAARGNVRVNIRWQDGQLQQAELTPQRDGPLMVACQGQQIQLDGQAGQTIVLNHDLQASTR